MRIATIIINLIMKIKVSNAFNHTYIHDQDDTFNYALMTMKREEMEARDLILKSRQKSEKNKETMIKGYGNQRKKNMMATMTKA